MIGSSCDTCTAAGFVTRSESKIDNLVSAQAIGKYDGMKDDWFKGPVSLADALDSLKLLVGQSYMF
jgi:hypothetical protein